MVYYVFIARFVSIIVMLLHESPSHAGINQQIPEEYHQIVKFYMESPGTVKWKHEHMNFFEAWQTMAEIASDKDLTKNLAPMTFDYHKYLNHGKYNINDMCKSFNEIESYGPQDVPHQLAWISEYKRRKIEC